MPPLSRSAPASMFNMGRAGGGESELAEIGLGKRRRKEGNNSERGVTDRGGLLVSLFGVLSFHNIEVNRGLYALT